MSHRRDPYPKKKDPLGDDSDGINSTEGKFHGESDKHSMGGNGDIQSMIASMMQGFIDMICNIIVSRQ